MKPGLPIVVSAPSGGGKTTLVTEVLQKIPSAARSVSCTTRKPRTGERNGIDYYFVSKEKFKHMIKAGQFIEWAMVHNNYYGTPRPAFESRLKKGRDVILTIDPQGAVSIRKIYPKGVFIFVVPPTWQTLLKRLKRRGTDDQNSLKVRIKNAKKELRMVSHYDYVVINDLLPRAVDDIAAILRAERSKRSRMDMKSLPIFR